MEELRGRILGKTPKGCYEVEDLSENKHELYLPKGSKVLPKKNELIAAIVYSGEPDEDSETPPKTAVKYMISIDKSNRNVDRLIGLICGMGIKTK